MASNTLTTQWGHRLKSLRKEKGMSLRDVTDATGLHRSHYCRIEAGEINPGDATRMKLAQAFGRRVEEIFAYPSPLDGSQDVA